MKKITIGVVLIAVVATALFAVAQNKKTHIEEIKVGAILPLSGDAAIYGEYTKKGILLGLDKINGQLAKENKKISVIFEDSKAMARYGVSAAKKLISSDNVVAIIDDSVSSVTLAVAPICEKNKVVLLATGATAPEISNAGTFIYRIWNSDSLEGKVVADYAHDKLGLKDVAILYVNNAYGKGLKSVFEQKFRENGGSVIASEAFDQGENDFRLILSKVAKKSPSAIYLVAYPEEAAGIFKQAKILNINTKWIGTVAIADKALLAKVKEYGFSLYYPFPSQADSSNPFVANFLSSYKKRYGHDVTPLADVGYDSIILIGSSFLGTANGAGVDVKKYFDKMSESYMSSGLIEFDENGDVNKPIEIKKVD
ncbi:ABC transporter substrate-binding protein [Desulfovibrio sp. JC010]|uniref:ABC transporter substrate-binding protein n=1 Tax=Desulfovibrio sp. JC010 TaxID=2593641 RepID=UPI0013D62606|nr:penicillin-binding protein activator [Desulfovibrio sp. JC010]NDV26887.1 ABC transporter substrate-binding protein [Desulfovibrio sp. JC010]